MARIAVLVDLSFFLTRYRKLRLQPGEKLEPEHIANQVWRTAKRHVRKDVDELYRILVYDCKPLKKRAHNPINGEPVDFSNSETYKFRTALHEALVCKRKVALRLGELADRSRWIIREAPTKALLSKKIKIESLTPDDVEYDVRQKGVDIKMGIDIASIAYKKLAESIVLITGDSDFVPAAKLARREGMDVVLDPLWANITPSLNEHIDGLKTYWPKPDARENVAQRAPGTSATARSAQVEVIAKVAEVAETTVIRRIRSESDPG